MITTNDTAPTTPEDSAPFTWGNFRIAAAEILARHNELVCRSNKQEEKIKLLEYQNELIGGALFDTIQAQVEQRHVIIEVIEETAKFADRTNPPDTTMLRAIAEALKRSADADERKAAALESSNETAANVGDQTSRAILCASRKLPPGQTADLEKSLGMGDDGETLKP
jgi:hypothetical protein